MRVAPRLAAQLAVVFDCDACPLLFVEEDEHRVSQPDGPEQRRLFECGAQLRIVAEAAGWDFENDPFDYGVTL